MVRAEPAGASVEGVPVLMAAALPRNRPAAGASGGAAPLPATFFPARYMNLEGEELRLLLHVSRDAMVTQLYLLIRAHAVFKTGEFLASYARLIELCTPPQPERGKRRPGPSMWTVRRCVDDLVRLGLVQRGHGNEAQGELRLWLTPPPSAATPIR